MSRRFLGRRPNKTRINSRNSPMRSSNVSLSNNIGSNDIQGSIKSSKYVVAQDGTGTFSTLCAAISAAAASDDNKINIYVKTGEYTLCSLENTKSINFISTSFGAAPFPIISGSTISHGNKSWYGFVFSGNLDINGADENKYIVKDPSSHNAKIELFRNCEFTNNYKFDIVNEIMVTESCFYNYSQLTRNRVIVIEPGIGKLECFNCSFFFCRLGGNNTVNVTDFIALEANTQDTTTVFYDCDIVGVVQGQIPFRMVNIVGSQSAIFQNINVRIRNSNSDIILFGHESFSKNIRLKVFSSDFSVESGSDKARVVFLSNIWSPEAKNNIRTPIIVDGCLFSDLQFCYYDAAPEEWTQYLYLTSSLLFTNSNSAFIGTISNDCVFNLSLHSLDVVSAAFKKPIVHFDQSGGTGNNSLNLSIVDVIMEYTFEDSINEADWTQSWGFANVDTANILHSNVSRKGFTSQFVGASTIVPYPTNITT